MVEFDNPNIQVVDFTDMRTEGKVTPKPFVAIGYAGLEAIEQAAQQHGIKYDQEKNLKRLNHAGVYHVPDLSNDGSLTVYVKPRINLN